MPTTVTMPVLGLTMEEGTIAQWLKSEGDAVEKDEPLLLVEMDKGTVEVPSPVAGVLLRVSAPAGTTVPVKTPIAEIGAMGEQPAQPAAAPAAAVGAAGAPTQAPSGGSRAAQPLPGAPSLGANGQTRRFASPRARTRARELGVDLSVVTGSGPNGRIVEADVLAAASRAAGAEEARVLATPLARRIAAERGLSLGEVRGSAPSGRITQADVMAAVERREGETARSGVQPLSRLRRLTAERMAASARTTARVTAFRVVDFTEAARFRQQIQPELARKGVARLPWDALIARAAGLALAEFPEMLGEWIEEQGIRIHEAVDVGIAVALGTYGREGLVVPVLRGCDRRSLRELAEDLLGLVDRAQQNRLGPGEMEGAAFAVTNLGAYGIDGFTPVIIPGNAAILGVGRIAEQPAVVDGIVVPRSLGTLSLAFDHRVVDGAPAAAFLARLAELLERPYALLGV